MKNLGTTQKKKNLEYSDFEEIDPGYFHIQFSIGGKVFQKAVDGLIAFDRESLRDLSDEALDEALNDCSYWRFTFLSAAAELEQRLMREERAYNSWIAEAQTKAKHIVIQERNRLIREEKIAKGWFGTITKQDIESAILTDPDLAEEFEAFHARMDSMRKNIRLLNGLRDVLQDRGGYLQSIGKRRLENRKLKFAVRDS